MTQSIDNKDVRLDRCIVEPTMSIGSSFRGSGHRPSLLLRPNQFNTCHGALETLGNSQQQGREHGNWGRWGMHTLIRMGLCAPPTPQSEKYPKTITTYFINTHGHSHFRNFRKTIISQPSLALGRSSFYVLSTVRCTE